MVTGAAIKLLLVGGKEDPALVSQGKDLMSLELSKVGQQLQSALGTYHTIMLCLSFQLCPVMNVTIFCVLSNILLVLLKGEKV